MTCRDVRTASVCQCHGVPMGVCHGAPMGVCHGVPMGVCHGAPMGVSTKQESGDPAGGMEDQGRGGAVQGGRGRRADRVWMAALRGAKPDRQGGRHVTAHVTRSNKLDATELTLEGALSKPLDQIVRRQLAPVWNKVVRVVRVTAASVRVAVLSIRVCPSESIRLSESFMTPSGAHILAHGPGPAASPSRP